MLPQRVAFPQLLPELSSRSCRGPERRLAADLAGDFGGLPTVASAEGLLGDGDGAGQMRRRRGGVSGMAMVLAVLLGSLLGAFVMYSALQIGAQEDGNGVLAKAAARAQRHGAHAMVVEIAETREGTAPEGKWAPVHAGRSDQAAAEDEPPPQESLPHSTVPRQPPSASVTRGQLEAFYSVHEPAKVALVGRFLSMHPPEKIIALLKERYHDDPSTFAADDIPRSDNDL
jgi:hypothetical protein